MKANKNRDILLSLLNGNSEPLKQHKAAELMKSFPSVIITLPDNQYFVGDTKAFDSRFVSKLEFEETANRLGVNKTLFFIPHNGRDDL